MAMFINENEQIVEGGELIDGVLYHETFPSIGVSGFYEVTETEQPTIDSTMIITGYRVDLIDEVYTQVWETREKTAEEYAPELETAKQNKKNELDTNYLTAGYAPILFTAQGSTEKLYDADYEAMEAISHVLSLSFETPEGFYWVLADNTRETPFLKADLQGLADAIGARNIPYFQNRRDKKDAVEECLTIEEVNEIVW